MRALKDLDRAGVRKRLLRGNQEIHVRVWEAGFFRDPDHPGLCLMSPFENKGVTLSSQGQASHPPRLATNKLVDLSESRPS